MSPPVDAAEFDAQKNISSIIAQFLCRNRDKGYSAKEIAAATGLAESDIVTAMLKLGLSDLLVAITGRSSPFKIEDATINGTTYYRCITSDDSGAPISKKSSRVRA
jgi:hypothetical protein